MKILSFLAKHPVFTYTEFKTFIQGRNEVGERGVESVLRYHQKAGHIETLIRGKLYQAHLYETREFLDRFMVASKLAPDSVISYHSALDFYGKSYSSYWEVYYSTRQKRPRFTWNDLHYRAILFPKALIQGHLENVSVLEESIRGLPIRVTSLERTLVDCLDRLDLSGGLEELWRSFESVRLFRWEELLHYALALQKASLNAKLGFYLDCRKEELDVPHEFLQALQQRLPQGVHYLERQSINRHEPWRYVPKWRLMVPESALHQTWDELH